MYLFMLTFVVIKTHSPHQAEKSFVLWFLRRQISLLYEERKMSMRSESSIENVCFPICTYIKPKLIIIIIFFEREREKKLI